ncbi:MAG: thermonuclease family protein, partial [Chloroflexota bacterium]
NCIPLDGKRESGIVVRVIDGDTAEIKVGLLTYTVRYIGIDTPETKKEGVSVQPWGPEATARNRELVSGKRVTLIRDPKNDDQDIYGRLLRYIIVDETFVNYQLVREGFAFLYISGHTCGPFFFDAYEAAQAEKVGLFTP